MTTPTSTPAGQFGVYTVQMGGCAACGQSVAALRAPIYASGLAARGVRFVQSPRHADIVILTGALTHAGLDPLKELLAGVPEPHALVAVGDCAITGGVFQGSPDLVPIPAEALDVHVEIAGCPPAPEAILAALAEATALLAQRETPAEPETERQSADDETHDDSDNEREGRDA